MKLFTAHIKVDRSFTEMYDKKLKDFTIEELQSMEGIINECCYKLEKYGYVHSRVD